MENLRAFGVSPRTWLEQLHCRWRDYARLAFGVVILIVSVSLPLFGFEKFWAPEALLPAWPAADAARGIVL